MLLKPLTAGHLAEDITDLEGNSNCVFEVRVKPWTGVFKLASDAIYYSQGGGVIFVSAEGTAKVMGKRAYVHT
jgi:hypothetical protein